VQQPAKKRIKIDLT
jgi:hypothetical protein